MINLNQINDTPIHLCVHSNPIITLSFNSETNTLVIGDVVGSVSSYSVMNWKHLWPKKNQNEQIYFFV